MILFPWMAKTSDQKFHDRVFSLFDVTKGTAILQCSSPNCMELLASDVFFFF